MITKFEIGLALAVIVFLALTGGYFYAKHEGAQQCIKNDTAVATQAEVKNAHTEAAGTIAQAAEDHAHDEALAAPIAPAPALRMQPHALAPGRCPVPGAGAAPGASDAATDIRTAGETSLVLENADPFIADDVQRARDADVEIRDRDELLRQRDAVCRGISPQPQ